MTKKVLLFSDCDFFAGCENMMAVIMNHRDKFNDSEIHFAYRNSKAYEKGLKSRIEASEGLHALALMNLSGYFLGRDDFLGKNLRRIFHILRFILLPLIYLQNVLVFRSFLKRNKFDIILLNNGGYPGAFSTRVLATLAKRYGVSRLYMVVNNMAIPYTSFTRKLSRKFDQSVKKNVDMFITGSENAGSALSEVLGVANDKRRVMHNCIESTRFRPYLSDDRPHNDRLVFTNIGLLEERKGQIVLLQAAASLIERRPELRKKFCINIEGEGKLRKQLSDFIVGNNLQDFVSLLGNSSSIGEVYQQCDVFVLPSISNEDLPNVISEAMLFSKPIIASNLAGVPHQVFDGENGFLVSPGDIKELELAVEKCIDNVELLKSMGQKSRAIYMDKFSVENALVTYQKLFS